MSLIRIDRLAERIQERRADKGIRETAREVDVSPATLSRVENGNVPDLETFSKICRWLGDDHAQYLGLNPINVERILTARVHFKKGAAIRKDSAKALSELIVLAQRKLQEEDEG